MATPTYDLLDSTTLGTAAASVNFTGISGDYRDLVIIASYKAPSAGGNIGAYIRVNGNATASAYSSVYAYGDGAATASASQSLNNLPFGDYVAGLYTDSDTENNTVILQLQDYSVTDKHKTMLVRAGVSSEGTLMLAGRWANTSAINRVTFYGNFASFDAGSTFSIYGVAS